MKRKVKRFEINTGVFNWYIMVFIDQTPKEIIKYVHTRTKTRLDEEEIEHINSIGSQCGKSLMLKDGETILWLKKMPSDPNTISILSHEASHITDFILGRVGVEKDSSSEEVWAYMIQHVVRETLKICKK